MATPDPNLPRGWYQAANGVRISPEQKAAFSSGLSRGLTVNAVIEILRGTPLAIQRQAAYQLSSDLFGNLRAGQRLNRKAANYVPNDADFHQMPARGRLRYRTVGMIDFSHLGIEGLTQVFAYHQSTQQVPLDTQRSRIFSNLGKILQSLKAEHGEDLFDVDEADVQFVSAEILAP